MSYQSNLPADGPPERPQPLGRPAMSGSLLPWLLGALVVLVMAVIGGLLTAWIVAGMRAVPPPAVGDSSPGVGPSVAGSVAPTSVEPSVPQADRPRFTPTPSPLVSVEPEPFEHIVERGESLTLIADYYGVELEDIIALNDIRNPNRIRLGQRLLIPGYGVIPSEAPD